MKLQTDVAVVGAGPCGATLANLLGSYGVGTVVIDREPAVIDYPRAVAVDDESLRTFQAAGVIHGILPDLIQNAPIRYHDSRGKQLAHVRPVGQPYGWPRRNLFFQPLLEAQLRAGLDRFDHVEMLLGTELTELTQHADGVSLQAGDAEIEARYVVGADGGRSFVRGAVGIELTGSTAPSKWLVVDVADDTLDAPYSAVYCDPHRPAMTIPLPYGHRRFEFKLLAAEDEESVVADAVVAGLLAPYYRGLGLPTVLRRRVYWHHSRIASSFQAGRVFLAGDAAHLQPPFFGQGMNSGIRDATNLAWKIAAVTSGRAGSGLLDSYDSERREHAETMVSFATRIGAMYQPRNRGTEIVRDAVFRGAQKIPGGREYILQMKYKPAPRYRHGVVVPAAGKDSASPVGRLFGQPSVATDDGTRVKLDDAVGPGFAVIAIGADPATLLSESSRQFWESVGATLVRIAPSRTGARAGTAAEPTKSLTFFDVDGAFRDLLLERPDDQVLVLRPDRYLAAAGPRAAADGLTLALRRLIEG